MKRLVLSMLLGVLAVALVPGPTGAQGVYVCNAEPEATWSLESETYYLEVQHRDLVFHETNAVSGLQVWTPVPCWPYAAAEPDAWVVHDPL